MEESGRSCISKRTNRWIKVGPQAVIGALETLEFRSVFRAIHLPPGVSPCFARLPSLSLSNYDVRALSASCTSLPRATESRTELLMAY